MPGCIFILIKFNFRVMGNQSVKMLLFKNLVYHAIHIFPRSVVLTF